ncbi:hypothetical protein GCM10009741_36190 [Kribbella lupini]|uniref:Uncharacterized protein n=1 Tax=Kribbella lupini TaxID=291602 RepID=A0ABN2AZN1_9ACTN
MKIELAKPATRVTASRALARRAGVVTATMTAKAGSYRTIADAMPMATNTAYSWAAVWTCDQQSTAVAPSMEPTVIKAWPPRASSQRPTGIDSRPETSTATVSAPAAVVVEMPSSRLIGPRMTLKA